MGKFPPAVVGGGDFLAGWRESKEGWFRRLEPLCKLKTAFCEY